jgi:diguanylate cyclase (GGDEF)-like protein
VRQSKVFLVACVLALAGIAVGTSLWLTSTARHAMVGQLSRAESVAAEGRADQIRNGLDYARSRLAVGAALPAVARAVTEGEVTPLMQALKQATLDPGVVRISITRFDTILITVPDGSLPQSEESIAYAGVSLDRPHVVISAPVKDSAGIVIGALNEELDLAKLVPQVQQPFADQQGGTTLVDRDGTVLTTSTPEATPRLQSAKLLELVQTGRPGTVAFHSPLYGTNRIATTASVAGYPWMVVVGADQSAAGSPAAQLYRQLQVGFALAVVLATLVLGALAYSVTRSRRSLLVARQVAEEAAMRDGLTGLLNRRALEDRLARLRRSTGDIGVVLLDVNRLKEINDNYGHAVGDEALRLAAAALREATRSGEGAFRFGGDEFLVLLEGVTEDDLARIAERIRFSIESHDVLGLHSLTAAVGRSIGPAADVDRLIAEADVGMYSAKPVRQKPDPVPSKT